MKLPLSIPDRVSSWLGTALTATLVIGLVAATVGASLWKPNLRVAQIHTRGTRILTSAELVQLAGIEMKARLADINLYAVQRRLQGNQFIRSVVVNRNLPDAITISVAERIPVASLVTDRMAFVDADGVVLPPARSEYLYDLPVLTGNIPREDCVPGKILSSRGVREALQILSLAKGMGDEVYRRISEIHIREDNELLLYTTESGVPVVFGRGEVIPKVLKLDGFWRDIVSQRGSQDLLYVDLRFDDQVVVRWK